jgi:hypothetical protein
LFVCNPGNLFRDPLASATQEQLDSQFWFDRTIEKFTTTLRIVPPCKELLGSARFQSRNAGLPRRISVFECRFAGAAANSVEQKVSDL